MHPSQVPLLAPIVTRLLNTDPGQGWPSILFPLVHFRGNIMFSSCQSKPLFQLTGYSLRRVRLSTNQALATIQPGHKPPDE